MWPVTVYDARVSGVQQGRGNKNESCGNVNVEMAVTRVG